MRFTSRLITMLLCGCLLAPAARPSDKGAEKKADDSTAFFATVDVNVVNVEVYVTDKKGDPVSGLTADDFELNEDGRPMHISNFYTERKQGSAAGASPPEASETTASPTATRLPNLRPGRERQVPAEQRLHLIVYVDNFNIKPFDRNRVFRSLRVFLHDAVAPGDKVMLVTYNRSIKELVPFTSDPSLVNSALFDVEKESGYAVHRDSDRRDALDAIDQAKTPTDALVQVQNFAGSYHNDVNFSIDALQDLISKLGGLPGRKALVYVSDGLPMIAGDELFYAIREKFHDNSFLTDSQEYNLSSRFQELSAQANANRVTFYTIDAGGLRAPSSSSVTQTSPGLGMQLDMEQVQNLQAPLQMMAEETGGKAVINRNDVGPALTKIAQDFTEYYSLGYQPAHSGDGRYHRIDVRLKGKAKSKKYHLRYRTGYRDRSLQQRMGESTTAALLFGEYTNTMGIKIHLGKGAPQRGNTNFLVPVRVDIPLGKIVMVPHEDKQQARLRLFLIAMDDKGGLSPVQDTPIPIEIPSQDLEKARKEYWAYTVSVLMRSGDHRLAVGIRDELGGDQSFVTGRVEVGAQ